MKCTLLLLFTSLLCTNCVDIPGNVHSNEGNEFYVGFFQNRFGDRGEIESIPPILWVTTTENAPVSFNVTTIAGTLYTGLANPGQTTYVPTFLEIIVFNSTQDNVNERFKGIHIKAEDDRKIVVYGQHEELASNDAFLALPVITLPPGWTHEYIVASVDGYGEILNSDSVALIVGTENETSITVFPTESVGSITYSLATSGQFASSLDDDSNTITIDRYQTVYLQVRGGDISGTRIIADKPISVFSGHECAYVPSDARPCDMLIEQIPSVDTWGTTVVTIPLRTRAYDLIKVIAADDFTTVNITQTDINTGTVTNDPSFTLNSGEYGEILISDFTLIQSNRPIGVFQFSTSWQTDAVRVSDPFMMYVPPIKQYRNSYAVATAPFDPSLEGTAFSPFRGPYVNYTNIVVPVEYFNVSLLTINNSTADSSDFVSIKDSDGNTWGYGSLLLLNAGAQVISHQNAEAAIGITLYGFSNQMSWGCTGGVGLAKEQLQITCAADCVSSRKIVNATLYLSASFTFQPTCKATISCDSGYNNTIVRKCSYYDPKSDLNNKWTWNVPPNAVNCTVEVDVLSRSGSTPRMRSCSFLWTYPEYCVQGVGVNESQREVFVIVDDSELSYNVRNITATNSELLDCTCAYHTLEEALRDIDSNTVVNITISHAILPLKVFAYNLSNITISGSGQPRPTVDCMHFGSFVCKDCDNITINNIQWKRCGSFTQSTFDSSLQTSDNLSGLHFLNCTNFNIWFSVFVASSVEVIPLSGTINIEHVNFSDNFTSFYPQVVYGGLVVNQYNIAMMRINIINCSFTYAKTGGTVVQLFIVNIAVGSMVLSNTEFINAIDGYPTPRIYGNSMVYINISSEGSSITFTNVTFQSNYVTDDGNILSIVMNEDNSIIQMHSCKFFNNTASTVLHLKTKTLEITDSHFEFNHEKLYLILSECQISLTANFTNLTFSNNTGGPMSLLHSHNISAMCNNLSFIENTLNSGKGLIVFAEYYDLSASLNFADFMFNKILTKGSAVYCSGQILHVGGRSSGSPLATHSLVISHIALSRQQGRGHGAGVYISNQLCDSCLVNGSYTIKESEFFEISNIDSVIYFNTSNLSHYSTTLYIEDCNFGYNLGTALHLVNSHLVFGYLVTFINNIAEHGAAIYMELYSRVTFSANSDVIFRANEARRYGGAIFCSVSIYNNCSKNVSDTLEVPNDIYDDGSSDIYNDGSSLDIIVTRTQLTFRENVAGAGGDSIYFNVQQLCDESFQSISNTTQHPLGKYMDTSPKELLLYSPANLINPTKFSEIANSTNPTYFLPNIMLGQEITVPGCLLDYNQNPASVSSFLISHIKDTSEQYSIVGSRGLSIGCEGFRNFQIIRNQFINSTGINLTIPPSFNNDSFAIIQLHSFYDSVYALKPIAVNLVVEILASCHAGFHYNQNNSQCVCYTSDDIISCAGSSATIRRGYWFGTVNNQATVSLCPVNYCNYDRCDVTTTFCPLLPSPDDQCSEHRSGTACGNCKASFTLSFDSVECVDTRKCTAGYITLIVAMSCLYWMLTIMTVFAVMHFQVGIGYFYSITFYYSIVDLLLGQALHTSDALYQVVTIVSSLARLTPQFLGQLCFVKGLSGIDQQYIHYIHPLAILGILLLLSLSTRFSPRLSLFVSRGIIHVIRFLLLLSYTSIASTSLLLMRPLKFTGVDKTYSYLSPDIEYFHGRHLVYGLVAIVCGVAIVIGLPLLLLLEPFLNRKINFVRIKPLLDQFQGYYKDKYRYFAAYYMIGRLVILIIANTNINNFFTEAYLQIGALVIMTLIHIIVRPYASHVLNAIDGFMLLVTILVAILQPFEASNGFSTKTAVGLSFFLVLLPLFIFTVVVVPYINRQEVKKLTKMFFFSHVKSSNRDQRELELQPTQSDVYQITVDQDLRESISTTIVSVSDQPPNQRIVSGQKPQPIKFQESLLELGID